MKDKLLIHPFTAIKLFSDAYNTIGRTVLTDKRYQKTRQAWAVGMFLLGLRAYDKHEWWFSPDFRGVTFDKSADEIYTVKDTRDIVVFEWTDEDSEADFMTAFTRDMQDNLNEVDKTIVCLVRRSTPLPPFAELTKQLQLVHPNLKDIWIVTSLTQDENNWIIGSVYPEPNGVTVDYEKILAAADYTSFLTPYKTSSNKVTYEPATKHIQLTPEFEIIIEDSVTNT